MNIHLTFLSLIIYILHLASCDPGKNVLFFCFFLTSRYHSDYYWRDYHGKIPSDAIEGGRDIRGHPTYIGQAFVLHHGILIGQIYPGQKSITTSKEGIHVRDVYNRVRNTINVLYHLIKCS